MHTVSEQGLGIHWRHVESDPPTTMCALPGGHSHIVSRFGNTPRPLPPPVLFIDRVRVRGEKEYALCQRARKWVALPMLAHRSFYGEGIGDLGDR